MHFGSWSIVARFKPTNWGDTKYGIQGLANEYSKKQIEKLLGTLKDEDFEVDTNSKLELRAKALEFTHPVSKKKMVISTD
jgi:23S rRNA-/tRNA-specific pseudouridylate synthase